MTVINTTRGTLLGENIPIARTLAEEANGLLGKDESSSIFLNTRWGIHTFGMRFPIDCVILDDKFEVKSIRENMKSNRFFFWWPGYKNVLELPAGTISKSGTRVGDILEIKGQ